MRCFPLAFAATSRGLLFAFILLFLLIILLPLRIGRNGLLGMDSLNSFRYRGLVRYLPILILTFSLESLLKLRELLIFLFIQDKLSLRRLT